MRILLNSIYLAVFLIALPVVVIARCRQGKGFRSWPAKFCGGGPEHAKPAGTRRIWFHAVSVGEVNVIATLIEQLKQDQHPLDWVVSTSTDTGFELARKRFGSERVFYCPWDFSWSVRRAFRLVQPDLLALAELEIWPHLVDEANRRSVALAVVNGRLSENSFRGYRRLRFLWRRSFRKINCVAAQHRRYADRFIELGVMAEQVKVTGSIKFDGAPDSRGAANVKKLKQLAAVDESQVVWLAGSTQTGEDEVVLQAFAALKTQHPSLRLIIAPRHPHRASSIAEAVRQIGLRAVLRSQLDQPRDQFRSSDVLIIDCIGELTDWWGVSQIAFVGGSLGDRGGQNMIEPAAQGNAVCFGPNTANFRDVVEIFLQQNAARVVHNVDQLADFVRTAMEQPAWRQAMIENSHKIIARNQGATSTTLATLQELLKSSRPSSRSLRNRAA